MNRAELRLSPFPAWPPGSEGGSSADLFALFLLVILIIGLALSIPEAWASPAFLFLAGISRLSCLLLLLLLLQDA